MAKLTISDEVSDHLEDLLHDIMLKIRREQSKLNIYNSISNNSRSKMALGKQLCLVKGMRVIEFEVHKKIEEMSNQVSDKKFRKRSSISLKLIKDYHDATIKIKEAKRV